MKSLSSYDMLASKSGSILAVQFQKLFFFFVTTSEQSDQFLVKNSDVLAVKKCNSKVKPICSDKG